MTQRLDRVDGLPVGSGRLDALIFGEPGMVGGAVDYEHRVAESVSLFGRGHAGVIRGVSGWDPDWGVLTGLRYRW